MASLPGSADNPFQRLIVESSDDPAQLQLRYETHRATRNDQQSAKIQAKDFPGWSIDGILKRLDGPAKEEGFVDPRNCLVIWARPPSHIRDLISCIQSQLRDIAPCRYCRAALGQSVILKMKSLTESRTALWPMPPHNLHTTVLEVAHSLTEPQIEELVQTLQSSKDVTQAQIAEYPTRHNTRLLKPMLSFDSAALALSFVPAASEGSTGSAREYGDHYTYHHLRRDIFDMVRQTKVPVASRYIVPSAHVTIARFINNEGFLVKGTHGAEEIDHSRVKSLLDRISDINKDLESRYWPQADGSCPKEGEWVVGQDKGLVVRKGRLWYGGGEDV
ncbi:RNA ligase/cyclic nucleotide phosphodiesterase [Penicillium canariense]|uniref:RNA ligase/cyclic nucleotide phosphodiesterase n=1 Tax=Penicillium canariense TaxID=189055 RepID=A0A9W9HX74_9EURO|nr:RNA ligase/cyclic nucleotide phosphodiesterase [Penicillium canariense]KAJ5160598.1 RNA ligase/cyclic nucleotide phosphodiesterase [Penicillium canariense]